MSISNLGAIGYNYQPQVTSFKAKPYRGTEDFQPGLIMPENEKKKKQLFDFLLRKGYSYDIIKEAFRQMEERR